MIKYITFHHKSKYFCCKRISYGKIRFRLLLLRQKGIVRTYAKVSSYFSFYTSVLGCKYPLNAYCLNRLSRRRGRRKSVMRTATLQNSDKGTLRNLGVSFLFA